MAVSTSTTVRELLTRSDLALTPSETKIAQVLLTDYPVAGLGTATALARRAGVSDPTVIRLVTKIGFEGYHAFQMQLVEEVEAGLRSPLMMMETKRPVSDGLSIAESYIRSAAAAIESAADMTVPQTYEKAVSLLMSTKGCVLLVGGRFSRFVSGMLAAYLRQFRSDVVSLAPLTSESCDILVELGSRDTLIVFDHRRYQRDVILFAKQAAERGVRLILFTDAWRSPIAKRAKVVIVSPVEVGSPYDSLAPVVTQVEALIAYVVARQKPLNRIRVQELDSIRNLNRVTIESTGATADAGDGIDGQAAGQRAQ